MSAELHSDWQIDTSAGCEILVYKNCSVIEDEQARYVLGLIRADSRGDIAALIEKAQFLVDGLDEEYVAWPTRVRMLKGALARITGEQR